MGKGKNHLGIYLGLAMALLFLASACHTRTENYVPKGKEYYNYTKGNERQYDMDSFAYDWVSGQLFTFHFLVTEKTVDTFRDLAGHLALRLEQYISRDSGRTYKFYQLHSVYSDVYGFQRTENNQRYVKVSLPVNVKHKWDGNVYNAQGYQEYQYTTIGEKFKNAYFNFHDCITVTQLDDSTLISADKEVETFASDTGLVYKYDKSIQYNSGLPQGHIVIWNLRKFTK